MESKINEPIVNSQTTLTDLNMPLQGTNQTQRPVTQGQNRRQLDDKKGDKNHV